MADARLRRLERAAASLTPAWLVRLQPLVTSNVAVALTLGVILVFGLQLRLTHVNWDQGQHLHPDERYWSIVSSQIQPPDSVSEYFDSGRSKLNPYNYQGSFVYGTFPLFLNKAVAEWLDRDDDGSTHWTADVFRDLAAEFSTDQFFSEELADTDTPIAVNARFSWVLDPIDGTNNFAVGIPFCAISLAVCEHGEPVSAGGMTFMQARTANEVLKAQERRLRLQQMKGEVVDRAKAVAQVFRLAREERDAWVNWPARVAAMMAAELEVDPHQLHTVLERQVREHLNELAEVRPNLR